MQSKVKHVDLRHDRGHIITRRHILSRSLKICENSMNRQKKKDQAIIMVPFCYVL